MEHSHDGGPPAIVLAADATSSATYDRNRRRFTSPPSAVKAPLGSSPLSRSANGACALGPPMFRSLLDPGEGATGVLGPPMFRPLHADRETAAAASLPSRGGQGGNAGAPQSAACRGAQSREDGAVALGPPMFRSLHEREMQGSTTGEPAQAKLSARPPSVRRSALPDAEAMDAEFALAAVGSCNGGTPGSSPGAFTMPSGAAEALADRDVWQRTLMRPGDAASPAAAGCSAFWPNERSGAVATIGFEGTGVVDDEPLALEEHANAQNRDLMVEIEALKAKLKAAQAFEEELKARAAQLGYDTSKLIPPGAD